MVPPQTWTLHSRLAPAPCDTGSRQGLRRRDDGYQLHLCVSLRCKRLGPACHPGSGHDPRRYVRFDPGQRTTPNSSSGHHHFEIGLSLNRLAFTPMQTDNAKYHQYKRHRLDYRHRFLEKKDSGNGNHCRPNPAHIAYAVPT